jgi:hypothetical protein
MLMTFLRQLEAVHPIGEFASKFVQIVDPMGTERGGIANKLPPDGATEPIFDGNRYAWVPRL